MATVVSQMPDQAPVAKTRAVPWLALAWFTVLLVIAYFPVLKHLVEQWSTDEDVGHGFFVPVVAAYVAWQHRDELLAIECKPAWGASR